MQWEYKKARVDTHKTVTKPMDMELDSPSMPHLITMDGALRGKDQGSIGMEKLTESMSELKTAEGIYTSMTKENQMLRPESETKVKGDKKKVL
jgi:hypothetical protein